MDVFTMALSNRSDFKGKNVHIIGMARSGMAAAEVLVALGAHMTVHDGKDSSQLEDTLKTAYELGVEVRIGDMAYDGITNADIVVTSPGVPETCAGLISAHEAGIPVLPEIELAYRISLAPIIAVTGTNGKTTTTALIGKIFQCDGRNVYIAGNIIAGDIRLALVLAAYQASENDIIVAEISSFQLELISSFRPRVGALLNVSNDHMDRHPDIATYAQAKARLFEFQGASDFAILNADDPVVMEFASRIKSQILQFSRTREVELGTFAHGTEVWLRTPEDEQMICDTATMKLRGKHNLENILAAAAAAKAFGVDNASVQMAVDTFEPPEHRLEPVAEINGVEFLNNSMCTNVAASVNSLEAIGRPAIVIAGGKDKGSDYGPLGDAFVRHAKHVVLIGADAPLIENAARAAGFDLISHAVTLEEAVEIAWQLAESGDTIVLSPCCASFDMFKDFEHRGQVFKAAVKEIANRVEARR